MSWRSVLKAVIRTQPLSPGKSIINRVVALRGCEILNFGRDIHSTKQRKCSDKETPVLSILCNDDSARSHPQELLVKAISEVSKTEGRIGQTSNVIVGDKVTNSSMDDWLELDQAVNTYPMVRGFTAIGTGGDDFVQSMISAIESVIQQPIAEALVRQKVSSKGNYLSVNIGPVYVVSREQVQAVYNAMRRDNRTKYFL